jgi:hypothetical protein
MASAGLRALFAWVGFRVFITTPRHKKCLLSLPCDLKRGRRAIPGLLIALALFAQSSTALLVAACAVAAMIPDPLQFAHSRYPREPHRWAHSKRRLKWRLGVPSQLAFSAVVVLGTLALRAPGA